MKSLINVSNDVLLKMEPIELLEFLRNEVDLEMPKSINSKTEEIIAQEQMAKATAYVCYFKELETYTKNIKRKKKRKGCSPEEADNLLGCEEVFATYKSCAEKHYDTISRMFSVKRIMLDEMQMNGHVI